MAELYTIEEMYKDATYAQLIKARNELIEEIFRFEDNEKNGVRDPEEWAVRPGPKFCYRANLDNLQIFLKLMADRYNDDTVMVDENV